MGLRLWTREEKQVAIELWRVETDLKVIRDRPKMPAHTLRRIIAANRHVPANKHVRFANSQYLRSLVEYMRRRRA